MKLLRCALSGLIFLASVLAVTAVHALPPAQGRVVLTITGQLDLANDAGKATFDMRMLEALPQHSFTTSSPWYKTPVKFTGPLLADVLKAAGARGVTLNAVALNGYKVRIPTSDASLGVVLARLIDDQPLSVRDRGPLFIVYPFDSAAALKTSTYYGRSIWQLSAIEVE
ncbi:MAG: hypothetical protein U1D29_18580 [Burkholderiales bacterium]|nr:hypothetical protein [Burkholderiales bacterium]